MKITVLYTLIAKISIRENKRFRCLGKRSEQIFSKAIYEIDYLWIKAIDSNVLQHHPFLKFLVPSKDWEVSAAKRLEVEEP